MAALSTDTLIAPVLPLRNRSPEAVNEVFPHNTVQKKKRSGRNGGFTVMTEQA
jgi:hypothetical protein